MTVRPTSFDDGAGQWTYIHDDAQPQHAGSLDPATVSYGRTVDGLPDQEVLVIPCPQGDATSFWPVGGGADALLGQMAFIVKALDADPTLTTQTAAARIRLQVSLRDGIQRWQVDDAALAIIRQLKGR